MSALPDTLLIERFCDPVVADHGFPATSRYVRFTWSAILGPTATLTLVILADLLAHGGAVPVQSDALARTLGVKRDVLARAIARLGRFGFLRVEGAALFVRTVVAPVPESKVSRLSPYGRVLHERAMAERRRAVA